uniref:Response regulator n=1 Tax=uncultured bacterium contig00104 TaxID=1181571 RepID=A0A806K2R6_9BACT|nr:response regulator [uncultured bacterium contig00104]
MLEKNTPDLVLLDVEMPEMNGYEAIEIMKAKKETAKIPVIFLTAKSDNESELKGLSLGATDYIYKPFTPALLRKRIEMHLELVNLNNNLQEMVDVKTKSIMDLKNAFLKTMAELVEYRDDVTGKHIERTTHYLKILIEALGKKGLHLEKVASWDLDLLLQSAQLHDIGKIVISDTILNKPDKLDQNEFEEIKKHTKFGEDIIEQIKKNTVERSFLELAKIFASAHHEKWDGSGYPNGLKGEEIPLEGRLMAIADVYDALISERPYKKAFTHEEAVDIILKGMGTHFDPELVNVFKDVSEQFKSISR